MLYASALVLVAVVAAAPSARAPSAESEPAPLAACGEDRGGLALVGHGAALDGAPWERVLAEAGVRLDARGAPACSRDVMTGKGDELVLVVSDPEVRPGAGPLLHLELLKDGVVERTARVDLVRPCQAQWAPAIASAAVDLWLEAPAPEQAFLDAIDSTEQWRSGQEPPSSEVPAVRPDERVAVEGALRQYHDPADAPDARPKEAPRPPSTGRAPWVEAPPMSPLALALSTGASSLVAFGVVAAAALAVGLVTAAFAPVLLPLLLPLLVAPNVGFAVLTGALTVYAAAAILTAVGAAVVVPSVQGLSVAALHAYFADGDASPYAGGLAALTSYASCLGFAGLGALAGVALLVVGPWGLIPGAIVLAAAVAAQATVPATFIALEHPAEKQAHHLGDRVFLRRVLRPWWSAEGAPTTKDAPTSAEAEPAAVMAF